MAKLVSWCGLTSDQWRGKEVLLFCFRSFVCLLHCFFVVVFIVLIFFFRSYFSCHFRFRCLVGCLVDWLVLLAGWLELLFVVVCLLSFVLFVCLFVLLCFALLVFWLFFFFAGWVGGWVVVGLVRFGLAWFVSVLFGLFMFVSSLLDVLSTLQMFLLSSYLIYPVVCLDRWGTTVDFTTSFLHSSQFSAFRSTMFHSRPVHSLMMSSHRFLCLPLRLPP